MFSTRCVDSAFIRSDTRGQRLFMRFELGQKLLQKCLTGKSHNKDIMYHVSCLDTSW